MIVNEFENSKEYRLQQIMHTLESIHGVKLDFESNTVEEIQALGESCEIVKNSIVKESAFNTTFQNPEYTKNMLILEAVRIYLAEIAPRRMSKKKKAVKESAIEEGPRGMSRSARDWALNKKSTDVRHGARPSRSFRQPGEMSKSDARDQLDLLTKDFINKGGKITKEAMDPAKMVKVADFGRKMMDYAQNARSTDDKELRVLNAISQVGDKLTQVGTPFGPKTLTDMDKKVIEVARRRMAAQGVSEDANQLSVQQLATVSDEALDKAYGYGRSSPGNTFGWQANLKSAEYAKRMIDAGVTDIEKISDAIHKGWNVTAKAFVQNPDQFEDTAKLKAAGKLEAKLQQREKLMNINYAQLPEDEKEKDRVVARALLAAITGQQGVSEDVPGQGLKLQPGMVKVKKDNGPEEVINTKDLENKQRQGYQPVAEDDELGMLYRKYGITEDDMDEAVDQDNDGDNDFADVMISRMMKSGMPKGKAIAMTRNKPYNKESMMEAKKPDLEALKKKKADLENKMDKIVKDGGKVLKTDPLKKQYDKVCADIKDAKSKKPLKEAAHMETHDDYQADMARSELYRNTKYAMDMMKMIGPDDEVKPWIASNLTKAAEVLDKVYHYMDYYMTFEQPHEQPTIPVDEEVDQIPGDAGSIARQNLLQIMEYSTKLFRMIKPGDKLEGWVAMKLTTASEAISSSKHHMDYVQFQKHAGDMMGAEMPVDVEEPLDEVKKDKKTVKEASIANILMSVMLNEEQDLAQAETLLAAKAMSDELQAIAEKLAKMSVDDLMPLVDIMKEQFGQDAANGFNEVVKAALQSVLDTASETKDTVDNAVSTMQQGGTPGVEADISTVGEPGISEPDASEDEEDLGDEFGATPAAAGEPEEPLGRAKKPEVAAPEEIEESRKSKCAMGEGKDKEANKAKKKAVIDPKKREKDVTSKFDPRTDLKPVKKGDTVKEAKKAKPDFLDLDKDGNKKETMKKAAADKKKAVKETQGETVLEAAWEKGLKDDMPRIVSGVKGLKSTAFKKKFANQAAQDKWMDSDAADDYEVQHVEIDHARLPADKKKSVKESKINEKAPPGKKAEDFIKSSKADFKKRYGDRWQEVLYATAWKKFGPKKESYVKATKMLETALEKKKQLQKAFESHKAKFARMVTEGQAVDPLRSGYGLEGQGLLDQLTDTNGMISKLKEMLRAEMQVGVKDLIVAEQNNDLATKLSETKARTPYGILWKDSAGKKNERFFETEDLRKYWFDLNKESLIEHRLVNPSDFDNRIKSLTVKKG